VTVNATQCFSKHFESPCRTKIIALNAASIEITFHARRYKNPWCRSSDHASQPILKILFKWQYRKKHTTVTLVNQVNRCNAAIILNHQINFLVAYFTLLSSMIANVMNNFLFVFYRNIDTKFHRRLRMTNFCWLTYGEFFPNNFLYFIKFIIVYYMNHTHFSLKNESCITKNKNRIMPYQR